LSAIARGSLERGQRESFLENGRRLILDVIATVIRQKGDGSIAIGLNGHERRNVRTHIRRSIETTVCSRGKQAVTAGGELLCYDT
jgi:hypothetical protein